MALFPLVNFTLIVVIIAGTGAARGAASLISTQAGACKYRDQAEGDRPPPLLHLCLNGQSQTDGLFLSKGPSKEQLAHETVVFSGLHLGRRHALLVSGRYFTSKDFDGEIDPESDRSLPYFLYQYGKLYHDPLQITIGKHVLPFGVERQPLVGFFSLYHPRYFWQGHDLGINITMSNTHNLFFQLGAFTGKAENGLGDQKLAHSPQAFTGRLFIDKPAWQGTKVILSLYGDRQLNDRLGLAIINTGVNDQVVQLEFIRSFFHHLFWLSDYQQLVRLFLQSSRQHNWQLFFLYDDVNRSYRFATLGTKFFFLNYLSTQLAFTFNSELPTATDDKLTQVGVVGGIGATL